MNRPSLFFLPLASFTFSSFLYLWHLRPTPTPPHPPLCFPAPVQLIGPSTCSPNFVVCQSHLSSLWRRSIGLLKAADGARLVPADSTRAEGGWLLFRIKVDSRSNPDRVLPSSLNLLSFNVHVSSYWKPLDETLLNDPLSFVSGKILWIGNVMIIPLLLFFFLRLAAIIQQLYKVFKIYTHMCIN